MGSELAKHQNRNRSATEKWELHLLLKPGCKIPWQEVAKRQLQTQWTVHWKWQRQRWIPFPTAVQKQGGNQQPHSGLSGTLASVPQHISPSHCSTKGNMMGGFSHRLQVTIPLRVAAAGRCWWAVAGIWCNPLCSITSKSNPVSVQEERIYLGMFKLLPYQLPSDIHAQLLLRVKKIWLGNFIKKTVYSPFWFFLVFQGIENTSRAQLPAKPASPSLWH